MTKGEAVEFSSSTGRVHGVTCDSRSRRVIFRTIGLKSLLLCLTIGLVHNRFSLHGADLRWNK